jgi:RNA polymerase sigma factor (sigma-70 family)
MDKERNTVTTPHSSRSAAPEGDDLCRLLLRLAHHHAHRHGLSPEDAEDCAADFATRMLQKQACRTRRDQDNGCFPAWLHRCAENHVIDFCRAKHRLGQHEQLWPETVSTDGAVAAWDCADSAPPPDAQLLRDEFWLRMTAVLERLPPIMNELLIRHHLHGECLLDLAASCERTPAAIQLILFRARRRTRALLERMGLTEEELYSYVVASLPVRTCCSQGYRARTGESSE